MTDLDAIRGAVARGWCSAENSHKEMDTTLALAIADEVAKLLQSPPAARSSGVPTGWRVMWFTGTFKCDSERWEIYDPEGNGGTVEEQDVRDDDVKRLLDALAAAERKGGE